MNQSGPLLTLAFGVVLVAGIAVAQAANRPAAPAPHSVPPASTSGPTTTTLPVEVISVPPRTTQNGGGY